MLIRDDVDELEVGLDARRLTNRFDDEATLHAELDAAPYHRLRFTLRATRHASP